MFIWGSVLFYPALESRANRGAWIFLVASLMYLALTGHDLLEVVRHRATLQRTPTIWDRIEAWAAASYVTGSVLFAVGSVFFMSAVGWFSAGAVCFIVGSALFLFGGAFNYVRARLVARGSAAHSDDRHAQTM